LVRVGSRVGQDEAVFRIWPSPSSAPLTDVELAALYEPVGPGLRVNFVTSVDGAVEIKGHSAALGSAPDKLVFDLLRQFPDALMVGAGTLRIEGYDGVRLDEPRSAWRRSQGLDAHPRLVVVSQRLALMPTDEFLCNAPVRPVIITCSAAPSARRQALEAVADVLVCGEDHVDLQGALAELSRRGITRILCEGGPQLFGTLAAEDLVDEVCLTVSPLLAGAGAGRIIAGPQSAMRGLRLAHALCADDVLILRYSRSGIGK
jgi:riboflavin biosynthesis pyrimidine reductase